MKCVHIVSINTSLFVMWFKEGRDNLQSCDGRRGVRDVKRLDPDLRTGYMIRPQTAVLYYINWVVLYYRSHVA
jgi:hypothetical protein